MPINEKPQLTELPDGGLQVDFRPTALASAGEATENLAERLTEAQQKEIAELVIEDFDADIASRSDWEKRRANWYKMFALHRDAKTFPWPGASNVGIPTMSIGIIQFHSRALEGLYSKKELVRGRWTDGAHKDAALRVGKHMHYQLTEEMEEWEEDMDAMMMKLPIDGSCFKKTYYDHNLRRVVSRYIAADDFVVPYKARRLEDAIRKTHVLRPYKDELLLRERNGEFINVTELSQEPGDIAPNHEELEEARQEVEGRTSSPMERERPRNILEQHRRLDLDNDGIGEPYIVTVDYDDVKVLRIDKNTRTDKDGVEREIAHFTHYGFLPNPEGLYHFGFGHLMEGLNEAINTIINQLIDSGTLSNIIAGMVSSRSGIKTGDLKFNMGEFKSVDISVDDIRKAIYQFKFDAPSNVLFSLLGLLQDYASKISSVSDSMIGQMPASDTTATAMLAVLEQGLKVFSTIQRRIHRAFGRELDKIFVLNSIYLNEEVYFEVQDSTSEEFKTMQVGQADYASPINVRPKSDPNIVSKAERLIKAQEAWEFGKEHPQIAENPEALYELGKERLRALEVDDVDAILPKPEPEQPQDLTPEEENAGFLREVDANVLPNQDHVAHLQSHEAFIDSSWAEQLTPQGKKLFEAHMRNTAAALYLAGKQPQEGEEGGSFEGGMEGVA